MRKNHVFFTFKELFGYQFVRMFKANLLIFMFLLVFGTVFITKNKYTSKIYLINVWFWYISYILVL